MAKNLSEGGNDNGSFISWIGENRGDDVILLRLGLHNNQL